ncbi:MAG: L-serine ammonia-lyase, iron-sulfur-dependent, subunit alpha [Spirochaetes bacterium]|nr:L-serine ammonia-lyase, iron-sulfur-dependent, subunit alpha [Spirochaetota bacterium]MBU1081756.1 L-serine ammonia-lyase, iron-sulfur-dependent, subunit alpha [Spirochaetota bacterium]
MDTDWERFVGLLRREVVPALGCTDPVAIALCAAKAREALGREPERIALALSRNILKNAMAVGIPGADAVGVGLAAALGAFGGSPDAGLGVLEDLSRADVEKGKRFVAEGRVSVSMSDGPEILYIEAALSGGGDTARAVIRGDYARVTLVESNGSPTFALADAGEAGAVGEPTPGLSVRSAYEFSRLAPLGTIRFMLDAAEVNGRLSAEGLEGEYGLGVGRSMREASARGEIGTDIGVRAVMGTAAAVDARMGGCFLPAMTNSGSGNQGITATIPVAAEAEARGCSEESLVRALALSHLVSIHIRQHFDRLSAMCGTIPAATGAACGLVALRGGSYDRVVDAIANMAGGLTGMVCDGAKASCALKAASAVESAMRSAMLAMRGVRVSGLEGIVDDDVEAIIDNLGRLSSEGMTQADSMILGMMLAK